MNIATTNGEKSIDQLAARLGGSDPTFRERLVEANPHLAEVGNLPPGTPVIVPETTLPSAPSTRLEGAYQLAREMLDATQAEVEAALQRERDDDAAGRGVLDSDIVQGAAAKDTELARQRGETLALISQANDERKTFSTGIASAIASFKGGLAVPGRRRAVLPPAAPAGTAVPIPTPVPVKRAEPAAPPETATPAPPAPPAKDGGPATSPETTTPAPAPPAPPASPSKDVGPITRLDEGSRRPRQRAVSSTAVVAPAKDSQPKSPSKARKKSKR